tara:strand:- start:393 stop:722 length:330 start_codon:yes stop_codon:yes gene_type:complete
MPKGKGTYGSQVGRPPKKYQNGGLINGKSHEDGGELIEVEGKEVVVNDSVNGAASMHKEELLGLNENPEDYIIMPIEKNNINRSAIDMLEYIDEHGDLPLSDARDRSKK